MSISGSTHGPRPKHRPSKLQDTKSTHDNVPIYWVLVMLLLLLDSMVSYLAINNLGISVPVNALVLLLFLFGIFKYGYPEIIWPAYVYFGIYGYFLGVTVAILSLDEFDFWRIRTVGGAAVAFAVGYASYFAAKSPKIFGRCLFLIGGLYAVVCFVALIKLLPSVFPIVESIGNRYGEMIIRPEITTDQNFQVFYFFPAVILLTLRNSNLQIVAIFIVTALGAYALAQLQTRSGVLVLAGTLVMAAIVGMRSRGKIDFRFVGIAFLGLLLSLVFLDTILIASERLIERFTVADFDTLDARADAFSFSILKLFDLSWWVPQGYRVFREETGMGVPHSTITAAYVEGGILGLVGWVLLLVVPLVALGRRWLRGVTDDIANIALCGGTASLITQLSLNAPLHEHIWLWAGAVIGALARPEVEKPSKETATFPGPKLASSMKARPGIKPMPGSKAKPLSAGQSPKTASNDALKLRRRQGQFPVKPRHDRGTHKT